MGYFREIVEKCKKDKRQVLVVDLETPQMFTTKPIVDIASVLGITMATIVRFLYITNERKYTKKQVIESLMVHAQAKMHALLKDLPDDAERNGLT